MKTALARALRLKCPCCGRAGLFAAYLKQHETCPHCGANLGSIRADDGPAWLAVLVCGHILAPVIMFFMRHDIAAPAVETGLLLVLAAALVFGLLPFSKSIFIAILWHQKQK